MREVVGRVVSFRGFGVYGTLDDLTQPREHLVAAKPGVDALAHSGLELVGRHPGIGTPSGHYLGGRGRGDIGWVQCLGFGRNINPIRRGCAVVVRVVAGVVAVRIGVGINLKIVPIAFHGEAFGCHRLYCFYS